MDGESHVDDRCPHPHDAVLGGFLHCIDLAATVSTGHVATGDPAALRDRDVHGNGDVWAGDVDRQFVVCFATTSQASGSSDQSRRQID